MNPAVGGPQAVYRLWIAEFQNWHPQSWRDVPPQVCPVEMALDGCFDATQAAAFLEGFNTQVLRDAKPFWAVATSVTPHYEGDLEAAGWISASRLLHCEVNDA